MAKESFESKDERNLTIVSVGKFSFEKIVENKFYPYPVSSKRDIKKYLAFYRTAPVSAVTHYCEVKSIEEDGDINGTYKFIAFGDKVNEQAILVHFDELKKLEQPVKSTKTKYVQNVIYTSLEKLKKAETLEDV